MQVPEKTTADYVSTLNNLGNALQEQGKLPEAISAYLRVLELNPGLVEAHYNLGNALKEQGKSSEATECFLRAFALRPANAAASNNLGNALKEQGRMPEAMECYKRALELNPAFAEAYRNYTTCRKFTDEDKALADRLEELLSRLEQEDDKRSLHFALGKIYGDRAMYDESFMHYLRGNQLKRKKYPYNRKGFSTYIDKLIRTFSQDFFKNRKWAGSSSGLPVFILGMPRSGTTLIEQIISSHPLVYGAGELKYFNDTCSRLAGELKLSYPECVETLTTEGLRVISEEYLAYLQGFREKVMRVTDKMPGNFLNLGFISLLFPKARVVHCRRNPLDTCLSIFFQNFSRQHSYSFDLGDLGHYYRTYERLMEHWRAVLPPGMMHEIQYEEVVERPEEMSRRLIEFCGLEWDDRCLNYQANERAVRTASSWQVRQPIYKTSKERWRKYEKHLGPLLRTLAGKVYPT